MGLGILLTQEGPVEHVALVNFSRASLAFLLVSSCFLALGAEPIDIKADARKAPNVSTSKARRAVVQNAKLKQFKDSSGNYVLTNRPEKYRRKGYVEVNLKYEPIRVAPQYKKMPSATAYTPSNIEDLVGHYAKTYVLDESLVYAVIRAESNFDPYAVSPAGARGLMQLMPETAADMGVTDVFDPAQNIAGGTQYLAKMLSLFKNDTQLALAAYNAGPQAVKDHGGIPPYRETKEYVKRVCDYAVKYAKGVEKAKYTVLSKKPATAALPVVRGRYMIYFKSGLTQPVDKYIDEDPFYYVQFGNRTAIVRKENVEKIVDSKKQS